MSHWFDFQLFSGIFVNFLSFLGPDGFCSHGLTRVSNWGVAPLQPMVVSFAEADSTPCAEKQTSVQPAPNSMPVVDCWPGAHQFQVTVRPRPTTVAGRQLPYVYSAGAAKLYTDMMVAVPFSFTYTGVLDPSTLRIRALPIYKESHHIQTPVRRCAIHREPADPSNGSAHLLLHVVRAEHPRARWVTPLLPGNCGIGPSFCQTPAVSFFFFCSWLYLYRVLVLMGIYRVPMV